MRIKRWYRPMALAALVGGIGLAVSACGASSASVSESGIVGVSAGTSLSGAKRISLVLRSDSEHGRLGSDGRWHDAIAPANLTFHVGQPVIVTIRNYDTAGHGFDVMGMRGADATRMMRSITMAMMGGSGSGMMGGSSSGGDMMRTARGSMIVSGMRMMGGLVAAGGPSPPRTTRFVFLPRTRGVYPWYCLRPCDPWAMRHSGYMRGHITVV